MSIDKALSRMAGVTGWFSDDEARLAYQVARDALLRYPQSSIVEIGSYQGRSTVVLASAAADSGRDRQVFSIDPHEGQLTTKKVTPTWDAFNANVAKSGVSKFVTPLRSKSSDVSWIHGEISLLHIDGLHDLENVKRDYMKFRGYVPPGAFIAFHDYWNPDHPDVRVLVDELVARGEIRKFAATPTPCKEQSLIVTQRRATFSIVIPTCGRETLRGTLRSVVDAGALPCDKVIVVGDGPQPVAKKIVDELRDECPFEIAYLETEPSNAFGARQRNSGMWLAEGSHLAFIDDDDVYVPDALVHMRAAAESNPDRIVLFQEEERRPVNSWGTIWKQKVVVFGNVGTQMIVLPNMKERFGTWPGHRGSDYGFLRDTVDRWPGKDEGIVWVERVVALLY